MKKIILTVLICSSIMLSCTSQKSSSSISITNEDDNKKGKTSVVITDENGSLNFVATEDIVFNEDETAIERFGDDGSLKFKRDGKKLTAETGSDGKIYYTFNGGAKTQVLNEEGAKFLAKAIRIMIGYGVGAKGRAERLFKKGGSSLILEEIDKLKSDYTKSVYLGYLLSTPNLSQPELLATVKKIGTSVNSDYEKAKLLKENSPLFLGNAETSDAYLMAVKGINSDYEKANALKELLGKPLAGGQFQQVLDAAHSIGSDYEKANVLKETLENNKLSADQFTAVLKTISSIGSDYEKSNVLKTALEKNSAEGAQFDEALSVIKTIDSDFEKANVLKQVAGSGTKTEQQWTGLITAATDIDSDFEKANVLIDIAHKMPDNENLKAVYMKAAKTISSEYELGRTIKASH
jgi:hypothetical protein